MRTLLHLGLVVMLLMGSAVVTPVQAATLDAAANRVLGQADFTHASADQGGSPADAALSGPQAEALDAQGDLYVADSVNNRVLEFDAPLATGQGAHRVFGQPSLTAHAANQGGSPSAATLHNPTGLAVDGGGDLFVSDGGNNRVLEYFQPLSTDAAADVVLGQTNFVSNTANTGGLGAAGLSLPAGLAFDRSDNLFVADADNNRVLEYDRESLRTGAQATQVIGQLTFYSNAVNQGGSPTAGTLNTPLAVVLDAQNNLYVADFGNNRVLAYDRPLTTNLIADHVFGQPGFTSDGSNNPSLGPASLALPNGVAVDSSGNLYVADYGNHRVLEYNAPLTADASADGVLGQAAFNANAANRGLPPAADSLSSPSAVALDAGDNLYVVDSGNNRLLEYDLPLAHAVPAITALSPNHVPPGPAGLTLTVNGSGFVPGSTVRWNGSDGPTNYLSGSQLSAVLSAADLAADGPASVSVFTPAPGGGSAAPASLSLTARTGHDAIADAVWGQPNFTANSADNLLLPPAARLFDPVRLAVAAHTGRVWVADPENSRVLSWPSSAALTSGQPADLVLGQPNLAADDLYSQMASATRFWGPLGVALDPQGNIYVADYGNSRVLEFNNPLGPGGDTTADRVFGQPDFAFHAGTAAASATSLSGPRGLALDALGNLYVADYFNNRVLEYDAPLTHDTTADRVLGQPSMITGTANNPGLGAASLDAPQGLTIDAQGRLYVADAGNNRVLEYDHPLVSPVANRVYGQPDFAQRLANVGGSPRNDCLYNPNDVAVDGLGHLYVADTYNQRVLEYDTPLTNPLADRVFGQGDFIGHDPNQGGSPSASTLFAPQGVAVDAQNNLYVADQQNNRVLEYDWARGRIFIPVIRR